MDVDDDVQVGHIRWRRVRTFNFARLFGLWAQEEQAYDDIFCFARPYDDIFRLSPRLLQKGQSFLVSSFWVSANWAACPTWLDRIPAYTEVRCKHSKFPTYTPGINGKNRHYF